ncbi:hypothetical protein ACEZCY_14470 [Streptacidiphilus sp. N1-12]|uniref:Uncharacterized protein n=2 Tax=Streptacidiphilus alkalitolerans TaxID=3342712 RepID=A0ABV6V9R2_9ACTN
MDTNPRTGPDPDPLAWVLEAAPRVQRLAQIRRVASTVSPEAMPDCIPAMLRDLVDEYDQLTHAHRVQRAEVISEVSEILRRVGLPAAADLLDAQVLLEWVTGPDQPPLRPSVHAQLLRALARFAKGAGLVLRTEDGGAVTSLTATAPGADSAEATEALEGMVTAARTAQA